MKRLCAFSVYTRAEYNGGTRILKKIKKKHEIHSSSIIIIKKKKKNSVFFNFV